MQILISQLSEDQCYKLLISSVVPRPIAWISTLSADGIINLAPFSAFTIVSSKPPMLAVSINERDADLKDTARNILSCGEFVINIADCTLANAVQDSSKFLPPEISEVQYLGLTASPSLIVSPPGVQEAPINLECRLHECLEFGERRDKLIVGEVVAARTRDGLLRNNKIETSELDPLIRVAGPYFARLGPIIPV